MGGKSWVVFLVSGFKKNFLELQIIMLGEIVKIF